MDAKTVSHLPERISVHVAQAGRLWLFLDYDGTLAPLAPTPRHVIPDPEVTGLLTGLAQQLRMRVAVISGRRLSDVEALVPVPDVLLAGTYGIELRIPGEGRLNRVDYGAVRPVLGALKPQWARLIAAREGFFLEDKGWALALHARLADSAEATSVLSAAHLVVSEVASSELFRVLDGHRFLEVAPRLAHKGKTVDYLLTRDAWPGALPIYLGDDDKDEEAFAVIQARKGIAILVAEKPRRTKANCRLQSPRAVRRWLEALLAHLKRRGSE
jgi:trehalose 6-phosphate phosphatase